MTLASRSRGTIAAVFALARTEAVMLAALAAIAGGVLVFLELADDRGESDGRAFDWAILRMLHPDAARPADPVGPQWLAHAASDFSALGSVTVLLTVVLAACGFLLLRRRWVEAAMLAVAMGGGLAISLVLKAAFGRERPPDVYRAVEVLNQSFPSGHAMLSAVVYLTLGAMLARATSRRRIRSYVLGLATMLALTVGVTRIYLGAHWTSDVLAGWCAGAAWATACWLLESRLRKRAALP